MAEFEVGIPEPGEFDPWFKPLIEAVNSPDVLGVLRKQKAETLELLAEISKEQGNYRYAPGKWTTKEVVGHLMDTERVFCFRALCFARGEAQALPGFEHEEYVKEGRFQERSMASLAREYDSVRSATLGLLGNLDRTAWQKNGVGNGLQMSVRAFAFALAGHEVHHMGMIRERYLATT